MAAQESDHSWPVAPLRETAIGAAERRMHLALLAALAISLLCHVIVVTSLRFRRDDSFAPVVPVEIFESTAQAPPQAAGKAVRGPARSRQNSVAPPATPAMGRAQFSVLGALWPELCASLDPAERAQLHLPDCKPGVLSRNVLEKALPLIETVARAHGWVPGEALPEIRGVNLDDVSQSGGILGKGPVPPPYPNLGAGSKTGAEDKDDRDQLKALWYLQGR